MASIKQGASDEQPRVPTLDDTFLQGRGSPVIHIHPSETPLSPTTEEEEQEKPTQKHHEHHSSAYHRFKAFEHLLHVRQPSTSAHGITSLGDDWLNIKPQQRLRSGSFSVVSTAKRSHSTENEEQQRSSSVSSKMHLHTPALFTEYPANRRQSAGGESKQVAFLSIHAGDVHEVNTQYPAGKIRLSALPQTKTQSDDNASSSNFIYEKHPRLLNSVYREDIVLKYELLVPPKTKVASSFMNVLNRVFARTGVITHGSRSDAQRMTHLPDLVVVHNDHTSSRVASRSSSVHNVSSIEPRSRVNTGSSHDKVTFSTGNRDSPLLKLNSGRDTAESGVTDTPPPDRGSLFSKRQSGSDVQTGGLFLNDPPHPPSRSPPRSSLATADRPDSPHIPTPTRTGGSLGSSELEASTPDRYQENASALYLMQPVSVNTFRRLRPTEAMSLRYIDRTSSLSLCVSGTDHSADLDDQRTVDDDLETTRGQESESLISCGEWDYGTAMIAHHKRALVYQGGEWLINNPDRTVYTLLYTKHKKVGMKDFAVDFRAQIDIDRLLQDAVVFLDTHDSHIYRIIQALVSAVVDKDFEATGRENDSMRKARCKDDALKHIFVDKSVTVLSRSIQGGCLSDMLDDTLDMAMACDQIWTCAFAALHDIHKRHVAFYRTSGPVNMGTISEELKFVVLIMTPSIEKSTKTALETARTFSTLFLDVETRNQLSGALDEQEFRDILTEHANRLHAVQEHPELVRRLTQKRASRVYFKSRCLSWYPGQGIYLDIKRRWPHYKSDYFDGIRGPPNTVHKVISTTVFIYFAVLLPTLAFGVLNDSNTGGKINVQKHVFAQLFGGLAFGVFGGQPLLIIMTTAPLGLYMRILHMFADMFHVDFFALYSCIGLWNCFFLVVYAVMNTSCLTNLCTRTIQDVFEMFALFAFVADGFIELMNNFGEHYFSEACISHGRTGVWALTGTGSSSRTHSPLPNQIKSTIPTPANTSSLAPMYDALSFITESAGTLVRREAETVSMEASGDGDSLMTEFSLTDGLLQPNNVSTTLATTIVSLLTEANTVAPVNASNFFYSIVPNSTVATTVGTTTLATNTSATSSHSDCRRDRALLYLLLMLATWWSSLRLHGIGKTPYITKQVRDFLADYSLPIAIIAVSLIARLFFGDVQLEQFIVYEYRPTRAPIENLPVWCVFFCAGVGFILSLLFFFDTTITNSVVCRPTNKLKKGTTYDYDLLVIALINGCLSVFALPWLYPTTPQSPLHLLGLADVDERIDAGHVYQDIVRVRETRLTTIVASIMIGLSLFMLPYPLAYIPRPVLNGLFLYMAAMSIHDNQLMERIMLLFTEQNAYPPHHYIRTVPQRQLHFVTVIQLLQLAVICGMGLYGHNIYVEMSFPIVLCLMFPIRHTLMPKIIDIKYLESLEGRKTSAGNMTKRTATARPVDML